MGKKGEFLGQYVACNTCGKEIYREQHRLKLNKFHYCSTNCQHIGHGKQLTKYKIKKIKCKNCKKIFERKSGVFCSTYCGSSYQLRQINKKQVKVTQTKPEQEFEVLLKKLKLEYVKQKMVNWKKGWKKFYDFYLPKYNLLIEIDGTYWHGKDLTTSQLNKQQWNTRKNDRLKNLLAKERGFKLKRIWSSEIKNLNLKEILNKYE